MFILLSELFSDPITKSAESLFLNLVAHSKRVVVEGAGHFLQETHGPFLAKQVIQFLRDQ